MRVSISLNVLEMGYYEIELLSYVVYIDEHLLNNTGRSIVFKDMTRRRLNGMS